MKKLILFYLLLSVSLIMEAKSPNHQKDSKNSFLMYKNPIINNNLADPFIRYEEGYYYFFATGQAIDHRFIPIYRSKDLSNWEFVRGAVSKGEKTDWNYKNFWAPEVLKYKGKFYIYFTASPDSTPANTGNRVGVAIADHIEGPYTNLGVLVPNASIDGHPELDKDGSLYIFYTIERENAKGYIAGQIFVDKMISPSQVSNHPKPIITNHIWQEGPFVLYRGGTYFLTYSVGNWGDSTYHIRYSTSNSMMGPYTERPDTILKSNEMVKGPGHHSFFQDQAGRDWIVYHGWDTAYTARYPRIDRIFIKNKTITSNGPTFTPQRVSIKDK
jgi:beta-xylosidase